MFEPYVEKPVPFWLKPKLWIAIGVTLFAFAVSVGFYLFTTRITSHEFDGGLKSVKGSVLTVEGSFVSENHPEISHINSTIDVSVDANTKVLKTVIHLPTQAELAKTRGYFDGSALKRETVSVSPDEMLKDLSHPASHVNIFAKTTKNIYKSKEFAAEEIKYEIAQ